mmetsp:Transcript_61606/g.73160  ORF Transcript_61606/g.73160 Transcript_61606/m.73160 type:complete len:121 (+) Transcript_61606:494-856(+)
MAYKRRSSRMSSLVPDGEAGNDGDNAVIHHDQYHIPPHKERSILRSAQDLFEGWLVRVTMGCYRSIFVTLITLSIFMYIVIVVLFTFLLGWSMKGVGRMKHSPNTNSHFVLKTLSDIITK